MVPAATLRKLPGAQGKNRSIAAVTVLILVAGAGTGPIQVSAVDSAMNAVYVARPLCDWTANRPDRRENNIFLSTSDWLRRLVHYLNRWIAANRDIMLDVQVQKRMLVTRNELMRWLRDDYQVEMSLLSNQAASNLMKCFRNSGRVQTNQHVFLCDQIVCS